MAAAFVASPRSRRPLRRRRRDWQMNEGSGASVMVIERPRNGSIGSAVVTSRSTARPDTTGLHEPGGSAGQARADRAGEQLDAEPELRELHGHAALRTTKHFGNIVQKGQAGSSAG
jgi:hypothetical protein